MSPFGFFGKHILRMTAIILAQILTMFASPAAHAWGCQGHEVVALIAEMHMTSQALAKVTQILKDSPIDPALSRYCKETGLSPMAEASTWADDFRSVHPETGGWHFIDIPGDATQKDAPAACPEKDGCLPKALQAQWEILRAPGSTPQQLADALRFVIHFLGDIHQPMH